MSSTLTPPHMSPATTLLQKWCKIFKIDFIFSPLTKSNKGVCHTTSTTKPGFFIHEVDMGARGGMGTGGAGMMMKPSRMKASDIPLAPDVLG